MVWCLDVYKRQYLDYADISDDKNAVQIEAAHKYGLLPEEGDSQDVPCFNPQETVTREYMAVSYTHLPFIIFVRRQK